MREWVESEAGILARFKKHGLARFVKSEKETERWLSKKRIELPTWSEDKIIQVFSPKRDTRGRLYIMDYDRVAYMCVDPDKFDAYPVLEMTSGNPYVKVPARNCKACQHFRKGKKNWCAYWWAYNAGRMDRAMEEVSTELKRVIGE
jgi:hypothetical protein